MNGKHFDVRDMEREYKRGRVEELKYLVSLVHSDCTDCLATKKFLEERIKELEKEGVEQNE